MLIAAVAVSVLGLLVGPALVALGRGRELPGAVMEGFTLGVIPALLATRLIPHVVEGVGAWALALVALGFGVVTLVDRRDHARGTQLGAAVVVPTLAVHAVSDGAGLAMASSVLDGGARAAGLGLAAALLLHRLPEGLFIANASVDAVGWRGTFRRIGVVALATVVGATLGRGLLAVVPEAVLDGVVALGLGGMLRLSVHSHHPLPGTAEARAAGAAAFLGGIALVVMAPDPEQVLRAASGQELSVAQVVGPMFVETSASMLLGLAAMLLVQGGPRWMSPLDLGGFFLSWRVLGLRFAVVQLAACTAMRALGDRDASEAARDEALDRVAPRYLAGLLGAAAMEAGLGARAFAATPAWGWVAAVACAAVPWWRYEGAALLGAMMIHKGASPAAAMLLVTAGAAIDAGPRVAPAVIAVASVGVMAALGGAGVPDVHPMATHAHAWVEWVCAAGLALLFARGIMRRGPRAWLSLAHAT